MRVIEKITSSGRPPNYIRSNSEPSRTLGSSPTHQKRSKLVSRDKTSTRKEWYDIKAPKMFSTRQVGKTLINRTQGTKIASEGLKGRVFEVSLGDLNDIEADFRKFKLVCEDVQGKNVLTNFHAMSMTHDKLCSIVKKWHVRII
ncbi:unnamed protein product [Caenorhabditis auriculariae]|uniref:Uncharacterized protein n=1 Tax=Caenorhabditis auriculariae TaxID=2777116 RepID=A0A8S1GXI7_9PELO|nr:unnamed protein product [Caenorhabditis auriculariae]